jgi:hypothetical protein
MKKIITSLIISCFLCSSALSIDLSGYAFECHGENNLIKETVAIHHLNKKKIRYSYVALEGDYIMRLIKNAEYEYEVDDISVKIHSKSKTYPEFNVGFEMFPSNPFLSFPHITSPKCKLIDIKNYDPFMKIDKYEIDPNRKDPFQFW